jgi:kynureninase
MTPLIASLSLFQEAGIHRLRSKSVQMTAYLDFLLEVELEDKLTVFTPAETDSRGCQLSLVLAAGRERGRQVFERLSSQGVIADWREPDVIRVAPVPLYNSHGDVWRFVHILKEALA